jgi:uncharacterized membrane protein (DUF485 family)
MSAQSEGVARISIDLAAQEASLKELIAVKARFLVPMIVIYMVSYIGLTALAGFAKGLMAVKVVGSLNLGFVLIALNYLLSWVLALVYVRLANSIFDPLVARVVARTRKRGAGR